MLRYSCITNKIDYNKDKGSDNMSDKILAKNYLVIGNSYLEEGNVLKAKKFFQKAYKADPMNIDVLYEFALMCADNNFNSQAIEYYDKIIDIDPNQAGAYYGKAIIFDDIGEDDHAESNYKQAIDCDPEYFQAYLYLADIYERKEALNLAEAYYKKALGVDADNIWGYVNYGSFLELHDRNEEALEMLLEAESRIPGHYMVLFNLGVVYKKMNALDQAILCYEQAIEANLKHPYSFLNLAVIHKEAGRYKQAVSVLTRGVVYNDGVSVLYYNRAIMFALLKEFELAKENLIRAIELSPSLKNYALKDEEFEELFEYEEFL